MTRTFQKILHTMNCAMVAVSASVSSAVAAGEHHSTVSVGVGVVRGEWATLRTTCGVVSLERRVRVLQNGRPGQAVRVKVLGTTTAILAQVTGAHAVEIFE